MSMRNLPGQIKSGVLFLRDTVKSPEKRARPAIRRSDIAFLLGFMRPHLRLYLLGVGLTIAVTCLGTVLPLAGKFFIDFVVQKSGTEQAGKLLGPLYPGIVTPEMLAHLGSLRFLVLALLAVGILATILGMARSLATRRFEQELTLDIQTALFNRVLRFPMSYLKNRQTGYLMSRISGDVGAVTTLVSQVVGQSSASLFSLLFSFSIIFALNAKLSIALLVIIPVTMIINGFFTRRYLSISRSERERDAQVSRDMQEVLSGLEVVKLHNAEEKETRRVSDRLRSLNDARLKGLAITGFAQLFSGSAQSLLAILIMWLGAMEIAGGAMTVGDYLAFTAYSVTISAAITGLLNMQLSLQPLLASVERLAEMFGVVPETDNGGGRLPIAGKAGIGEVRFRDVSFTYDGRRPVLEGIDFRAARGDIVALVGPSGAGKTTIAGLLLKLYMPTAGTILLDGHDLEAIDTGSLRDAASVVSQDVFLFDDTVERNIKYGWPEASHEDVVRAARKARIDDFVEALPNGYATLIGERGSKLSSGQRQRISLARAFLKDAPLLILDEPTSALDPVNEALFRDSLEELAKDRITLVISHRMSLCDMATKILVIKEGGVAESGTHGELLARKGVYYEQYRAERGDRTPTPPIAPVVIRRA